MVLEKEYLRPYQLPQRLYGFWFEVGETCGIYAQSGLELALCASNRSGQLRFPNDRPMDESTIRCIQRVAYKRGIRMQMLSAGIWTFD